MPRVQLDDLRARAKASREARRAGAPPAPSLWAADHYRAAAGAARDGGDADRGKKLDAIAAALDAVADKVAAVNDKLGAGWPAEVVCPKCGGIAVKSRPLYGIAGRGAGAGMLYACVSGRCSGRNGVTVQLEGGK